MNNTVATEPVFRVLAAISAAPRPLGVSEIRRALGLPLSTAHRLLSSLEQAGYIERYQSSTRYVTGANARQLAHSFFSRFRIREACIPYLQQIAFACGETTSLAVPVGWQSVRIASVSGTNDVVSSHSLGETRALDRSPGGLALLAAMPAETLNRFIAWRVAQEPRTTATALRRRLAATRACGYASEETVFAPGRAEIAIAIVANAKPFAAICLEGPVIAADEKRRDKKDVARWLAIAADISRLADEQAALAENHYAHLPPETAK